MKREQYNDLLSDDYKGIDYKTIIFEYLLYWPLIAIFLVASLAGAYIYLRYQTPIFSVSSTVLIKQGDKTKAQTSTQLTAMQDLGMLSMANNFDNEIEILQSFSLIKKVVNNMNLYIDYVEEKKFGYDYPLYKNSPVQVWMTPEEAENLPSPLQIRMNGSLEGEVDVTVNFFANQEEYTLNKKFQKLPAVFITPVGTISFSASSDSLSVVNRDLDKLKVTILSPSGVADSYKGRLKAAPTSEYTSIVRLVVNDTSIPRGAEFLNTLVNLYNDEANKDKNQVAIRTAEFIDGRIRVINEELGTTENELADYKQRAGLTDLSTDAQFAMQGNSEYDQKRADNANQLRLVSYLREYITDPKNKNEVIPVNVGLTDVSLTNIIAQFNEMIIERKRLLRTSKAVSPAVINLDASIAATRNTVFANVESVEKSLQITRNHLDIEAGKYRTRISNAPKQERDLRDISRQQEIKSNLYLMLLQKREENAITLAAKANNGRVIEEPRVYGFVYPNGRNTYMIAFILGLFFPLSGIWISRLLRFHIEGRKDVEKITSSPVIGDIPQIKINDGNPLVIRENRNEVMEEIYRSLRTNILYMLQEDEKVILVTSTTSSEGKSFNASNLAASFAFMDKKTVLVGLDIRKPSLHHIFNVKDKENGITKYLVSPSQTDLLSCCHQSIVSSNLYILPSGTIPPNPTELVMRKSLDQAISILKENFDYVILDTAPIGMVTDTRLISRVADLCVYVCRADYTRKTDFELINELEQDKKLPPFCVLINGIDMNKRKNGYYYGYGKYAKYGKYGKQYKHGYGYGYGKGNKIDIK